MAYVQPVLSGIGFAPAWVDSAITVAEKALSIDPDLAEAHMWLWGMSYYGGKGWLTLKLSSATTGPSKINPNDAAATCQHRHRALAILGEIAEGVSVVEKKLGARARRMRLRHIPYVDR